MENSAEPGRAPVFLEKREAIRPSLATMNNHGTAGAPRELQLFDEDALLNVTRGMIIMIIEADFAPSDKFRMLRQIRELVVMRLRREFGLMRVNPCGSVNPLVAFRERQRRRQRARSTANGKNLAYAGRLRPRKHVSPVGIEFRHIDMRMRIDQLKLCGS